MRSKKCARAVDLDEMLEGGVGNGEAVEGRCTSPELVEEDLQVMIERSARV